MAQDWSETSARALEWIERAQTRLNGLKARRDLTVKLAYRPKKKLPTAELERQLAWAQKAGLRQEAAMPLMTFVGPMMNQLSFTVALGRGAKARPVGELSIAKVGGGLLLNARGRHRTWSDDMPAEEVALRKELILFSDHPVTGDGEATAMRVHDGELQLWWQDAQGTLHALEPDLGTHFDAMLDLAGWFGWQALFAEVDLSADPWVFYREGLENLFARGDELFPDVDLAPYRARFDARGGAAGAR